jgi:hypothetical protein
MASTDLVTPAKRYVYIGDVESNRPNSASINQKISGGLNWIYDKLFFDEDFTVGGFFNEESDQNEGSAGIRYIENDCSIASYQLALRKAGTSSTSAFNVAVYDSAGSFVNNLFGTGGNALSISGNNGTNVVVGKKGLDTVTPSNILINNAGHTVFPGNLNLTTLLAGYVLVPFVVSNATNAYNLNFKLRLKEI